MFADAELTTGHEKLASVPKASVFESNGKLNVLVVKDGKLEQRVLQTGPEVDGRVTVRRGVVAGEPVATPYSPELKNGLSVK
jgi:hypothetical protein